MKKSISAVLRSLTLTSVLLIMGASSYASHILGAELRYKWMSGLTYQVTVVLYGDCGSTSGVFNGLPISQPQVCIYNGGTSVSTISLSIDTTTCGTEVSRICPDSLTNCSNLSNPIPGIKKFVYSGTYTFPSSQPCWRLIYTGNNGGGTGTVACSFYTGTMSAGSSGRSAIITNINTGGGGYEIQLIDTLNTAISRGHNSSPVLFAEPQPVYCSFSANCFTPDAVDAFDSSSSAGEPAGDSMVFSLVVPTNGSGACGTIGGPATYLIADAWTVPSAQPMDGAHPIQCTSGTSFSFNTNTGQLCFNPITQRSTLVYNIEEYYHDTLVGNMQREMNFYVRDCGSIPCLSLATPALARHERAEIYPNPASSELTITSESKISTVSIANMLGQTIYNERFDAQKVVVNVAGLPGGVYFIKINGTGVKRFIKE